MKSVLTSWQLWALLSAGFAALTAIFAKVGIEHVNSDFATFIRTIVILLALGAILVGTGQWQPLGDPGGYSTDAHPLAVDPIAEQVARISLPDARGTRG